MSTESLKADLKSILVGVATLDPLVVTTAELVAHMKNELYPLLENVVDELDQIDRCVGDILDGAEDILQPETAEIFAAIIAGGAVMAAALKARITREADPMLWKAVVEFEANCKKGGELLEEIVIDPGEDEDEDLDDPGDPDDDDDEDDRDDEGETP